MSPSVVVVQSPGAPYSETAGFARVTPLGRNRRNREQLSAALTVLSLSAWSYTMIAGVSALS